MGCLGTAKQYYDAAPFVRNVFHRGAIRPPWHATVIQSRAEKVSQCIHRLHAHWDRTGRAKIPYAHGEVQGVVDQIPKGMQGALTPLGVHRLCTVQLDRLLMQRPIFDEICDRANVKAVFLCKNLELWSPRHGAIRVHDLHNHCSGRQARHARQINTGLGMASTLEHAARFGD